MRRKYDRTKRAAQVEATKRRIVEATMALHHEQGVLATRWEQIAERAGVSPATVYRYFPSLDELLPACGELSFRELDLPDTADVAARLAGCEGTRSRIRALVGELFAIYERGGKTIWAVRRDRTSLAPLAEAHERIEDRIDEIIDVALEPLTIDREQTAVVRALTDYDSWNVLRERGIEGERAAQVVSELISGWLERAGVAADG